MKFKIHAADVRKAAKKTGKRIVSCKTLQPDCGCPIALLAVASGSKPYIWDWAYAEFGREYCNGFVDGFDGFDRCNTTQEFKQGYNNGKRLRKFLLNK